MSASRASYRVAYASQRPSGARHGPERALVLVGAHHDAPGLTVSIPIWKAPDLAGGTLLGRAEVPGGIRIEVVRVRRAGAW